MILLLLMIFIYCNRNFFGHLVEIRGDKYADVIDKESPDVYIIISIYEEVLHKCSIFLCLEITIKFLLTGLSGFTAN